MTRPLEEEARELARVLSQTRQMVFLGGAGVSTESGVPDYRSAGGLYSKAESRTVPGKEILSRSFFDRDPETHFQYYKGKLVHPDAEPNDAHHSLARLEEAGLLQLVITQNIDGLHQRAGSKQVYEMHGSMWRNTCLGCGKPYSLDDIMNMPQVVPVCADCGGIIRPDTVLYEETLDKECLKKAIRVIKSVDTMLVGGTALAVNPARGLVKYFRGSRLVFLNHDPTPLDHRADLLLRGSIGSVLRRAVELWETGGGQLTVENE